MGRTACTKLQCLYKGDLYLYLTLLYVPFTGAYFNHIPFKHPVNNITKHVTFVTPL